MDKGRSGPPAPVDQLSALTGWFKDFFQQFVLAWRLLLDSRISFINKIIPFLTVGYLISPLDLVPDVALGLGQLDDLAVLLIGLKLFVETCPPDIVAEHRAALEGKRDVSLPPEDVIIDVEVLTPEEGQEE